MDAEPLNVSRLVPMPPISNLPERVACSEKLGFHVANRNDEWGWAMLRSGRSPRHPS